MLSTCWRVDNIDDEGAAISLYTARGRRFAHGDHYRGFEWDQ